MRPSYTQIHPTGTFQNQFTGALFSFMYRLLDGFIIGEKWYTIGPNMVTTDVSQTTNIFSGFDITITHQSPDGVNLLKATLTMKMLCYIVTINQHKHCSSPLFEILPASPFELARYPPVHEICVICMENAVNCTISGCQHFLCLKCCYHYREHDIYRCYCTQIIDNIFF